MKFYVVSDVHGFYTQFNKALEEKGYFSDQGEKKLIILGDLFDRGKECRELQSFIVDLIDKDEVILVKGNHEDLIEELVDNLEMYTDYGIYTTHHYRNGTMNTICDLLGISIYDLMLYPDMVRNKMRCTPYFKRIIPSMIDYFETEKYIFVHGWIPCKKDSKYHASKYKKIDDWRESDEEMWKESRWSNGMEAAHQGVIEEGKTILCGHWHASYGHSVYEGKGEEFGENSDFTPYYGDGIIAIDGCTAYSKTVNVVVIEDEYVK